MFRLIKSHHNRELHYNQCIALILFFNPVLASLRSIQQPSTVQLSSCITNYSYHGPACPHLGYLKELIGKLGLDVRETTSISQKAEKRRQAGRYKS